MTEEPQLKLTMKVGLLLAILTALSVLRDEIKIRADNKRLTIKIVDPAHVAMMQIDIKETKNSKIKIAYKGPPGGSWGLDNDTLKNFLMNKEIDKDKQCTLTMTEKETIFNSANFEKRMKSVDTRGMSDAKIPSLTLQNAFTIPFDLFKRAVLIIDEDHIKITSDEDGVEIITYEDDNGFTKTDIDRVNIKSLEAKEAATSLFPKDYLSNMIHGINDLAESGHIKCTMGNEYPLMLEWSGTLPDGPITDGQIQLLYLLAPRIENS